MANDFFALFGNFAKNGEVIFSAVLLLAIDISLLVATPVYAEFRYAYAFFCTVPIVLVMSFFDVKKEFNLHHIIE